MKKFGKVKSWEAPTGNGNGGTDPVPATVTKDGGPVPGLPRTGEIGTRTGTAIRSAVVGTKTARGETGRGHVPGTDPGTAQQFTVESFWGSKILRVNLH